MRNGNRWYPSLRLSRTVVLGALMALPLEGIVTAELEAQEPEIITVALGNSQVISSPTNLLRVLIGDPSVADVVAVSARDIVVNGVAPGTTTLLFWETGGPRRTFTVRVTLDAATIESELNRLFPAEDIQVSAIGSTLILAGDPEEPGVAERALALATSMAGEGTTVLDHMIVQDRGQVMLRVRIAEVSRSAIQNLGANVTRLDPLNIRGDDEGSISTGTNPPAGNFLNTPIGPDVTFSDAVNFFLFHDASNVSAFIQALRDEGDFRSLAEPNLMTLPGETASFLAGGEFPYPVLQGAGSAGAVTIVFQEFGVRLNFTPQLTNNGRVRLNVEPEVSSLDFSNGLELSGFQIPALLSRRANTTVEVGNGQTFAIAGLMDNRLTENVSKVPLLGDIPILGSLFRSTSFQRAQTELLVLVTPVIVTPDMQVPPIPTGEFEDWGGFQFSPLDGQPGIESDD